MTHVVRNLYICMDPDLDTKQVIFYLTILLGEMENLQRVVVEIGSETFTCTGAASQVEESTRSSLLSVAALANALIHRHMCSLRLINLIYVATYGSPNWKYEVSITPTH